MEKVRFISSTTAVREATWEKGRTEEDSVTAGEGVDGSRSVGEMGREGMKVASAAAWWLWWWCLWWRRGEEEGEVGVEVASESDSDSDSEAELSSSDRLPAMFLEKIFATYSTSSSWSSVAVEEESIAVRAGGWEGRMGGKSGS
jgi:hypothetical protein